MNDRRARLVRAGFYACGALAIAACAGDRTSPPPLRAGASERGPLVGLELRTWTAGEPAPGGGTQTGKGRPAPRSVPEVVFSAYAQRPLPFSAAGVEAWRACGIGIVSVPVADLEGLRGRLALIGPIESQQVPLSPRWIEGAAGPASVGVGLVALDTGTIPVDRARLRLLVRSWAVPADMPQASTGAPARRGLPDAVPARAHLQVVPQVAGFGTGDGARQGTVFTPEDQRGQVLSRLQLEGACGGGGGEALVFYPLLVSIGQAPTPTAPPAPAPAPAAPSTGLGPDAPTPFPLGEALLSDAFALPRERTRTILIIVPHPPREFRLIE